jgi:hypothetical protein
MVGFTKEFLLIHCSLCARKYILNIFNMPDIERGNRSREDVLIQFGGEIHAYQNI